MKKLLLNFTKEQKEQLIYDIQRFFLQKRDEKLGNLEAEELLEFFKEKLGPHYFNEGVAQARRTVMDRALLIEEDLYALEKPIK
ncbi:hypothetical protein A8F94_01630 [Bacillus sp. FJAT-27225]|uniref:DUF2164 domain-containing protein n=1 Tax=Bacillus sp. FJAT-27225 TaxID=1743144 RepID=UPI00080C260E|nr:DUF2164 domain-containing protein [Bacillus sp. FJAT-27225]OCA90606.1 hypothetical protein A8F94_01630 [Bacillus sp. FJAT-27225]